jgi:excinuclease UvrABC nuclease subunit
MHGVYKYEYDGKVIYVGKTNSDFANRIACHGREESFSPYLPDAKIFVYEAKSACEADFLETLLINQHDPELNTAKRDLTDVEVFANVEWEPWDDDSKVKYKQTKGLHRTYGLVSPSVYEKVSAYAKANNTSFNAIVCELLERFVEEKGL